MKQIPTIGRIVIIHQPPATPDALTHEQIPAIVTRVHNEDCVNLTGFLDNGNVSGFFSCQRKGVAPEGATCWDWPVREG